MTWGEGGYGPPTLGPPVLTLDVWTPEGPVRYIYTWNGRYIEVWPPPRLTAADVIDVWDYYRGRCRVRTMDGFILEVQSYHDDYLMADEGEMLRSMMENHLPF